MRYIKNNYGNVMMVTNGEYEFIRKLKANSKLKIDDLDEYSREIGNKLYSKSAVQMDEGEEYFLPLRKD